jgi:D-alanyl-lipoteichoic acid acyltransferase DltB (MBOAT superfamily)
MNALASSIAVDEFGRPFIILREHKQERLQGLDALKVRIQKQFGFGSKLIFVSISSITFSQLRVLPILCVHLLVLKVRYYRQNQVRI